MRFRYVGEEPCEWFGFKWLHGVEHDVTDAHAVGKLCSSVLFEAVDEAETVPETVAEAPKKRGGRPRKVAVEVEADADDHAHDN